MSANEIKIYSDGACSGNPGPGGFGSIVIIDDKLVKEFGDHYPATTNNRMELQGVISALVWLKVNKMTEASVTVFTDSVYVIRGITQWVFGWKKNGWKNSEGKEVVNQDLWIELEKLVLTQKNKIKWLYVRGHNGDHGNERCDTIAVAFSKRDYIKLYEGDASAYHFDVRENPKVEPLPDSNWKSAGAKKAGWYLSNIGGNVAKHQTWSECEARVKGQSGAKFKKVTSSEEEATLLKSWGKL